MTAILALLQQWLGIASGAITAGEGFWSEISAVLERHGIEHDKAQLLKNAAEAREFGAREHLIATGELVVGDPFKTPKAPPAP